MNKKKEAQIYALRDDMLQAIQDHVLPVLAKHGTEQQQRYHYMLILVPEDMDTQIYSSIPHEHHLLTLKFIMQEYRTDFYAKSQYAMKVDIPGDKE